MKIRALRDPRDAIQDLYLPPGQYENTRFSFHCYSDPERTEKLWLMRSSGRVSAETLTSRSLRH